MVAIPDSWYGKKRSRLKIRCSHGLDFGLPDKLYYDMHYNPLARL
jgi:hypothetical protein